MGGNTGTMAKPKSKTKRKKEERRKEAASDGKGVATGSRGNLFDGFSNDQLGVATGFLGYPFDDFGNSGVATLKHCSGSQGNLFAPYTDTVKDSPNIFKDGFASNASGSEAESDEGARDKMEVKGQKEQGPWVSQIIEDFIWEYINGNPMPDIFNKRTPEETLKVAECFFKTLNQKIELENKNNNYQGNKVKIRQVPYGVYFAYWKAWIASLERFKDDKNTEKVWEEFDKLQRSLEIFNKLNLLPEGWNLDVTWAEDMLRKQMKVDDGRVGEGTMTPHTEAEDVGEPAYDLQSLKLRSRPAYMKRNECQVLYWWKTEGTTSDYFVEYQQGDHYIHQIKLTDYHDFDQNVVPCVMTQD
ncbi:hypothetical protein FQN50_009987 [Emmonsiellopsis sp. PD_5]|nr:hypothetical protein FQN50_009987 [Emmonsiellopsis sp. PD_5]